MLNKKRDKSKEKNIEKNKKIKKDKLNNKNKIYKFEKNQNYTLDGYGKLKLIDGQFNILGYSLSKNEVIEFNFNEDYPLFKHINSNNSYSEIEIFEESKYHLYTDINSLIHVSFVPKSLISLDLNKYNKYFICGKKCVGKNMLIPYLINRILTKKINLYYLECDIIHPIIPFNFNISLIEIKKPIISNIPIIFNENKINSYYNILKSYYIRNIYDIKNIFKIIDILINDFYVKISNDNSILIINQFSEWDNNYDILNNYLYKNFFKNDDKSCILYIKNKYKNIEISSNDNNKGKKNNNSILEDIIFKNKNDFYLFGNIFENNNINNNEIKCKRIEIETNFKYGDDDDTILNLNNKKKNEEKLSILHFFEENNCQIYSLSINKIIIFYDNSFINEFKNNCKTKEDKNIFINILIESLINKYCVILKNDLNENKNNDYYLENYYLNDKYNEIKEIISYIKVISFDKKDNIIYFYGCKYINEEIKKNKKIILLIDNRIEKSIQKNKKDNFFRALSKTKFSYDITKEKDKIYISNGFNYFGKIDDEIK